MGLSIGNRLLGSTGLSNGFGLSVGNGLAFLGFGAAFSPAELFAANEPGAWYDPSDLTTLFQDAAGTTPVTAVEQPVGLMLDKSKGLVLGPELVTNGDFSQGATGWVPGVSWAITEGKAVKSGVGTDDMCQNIAALTIGKFYKIELDQTYIGGPFTILLRVGSTGAVALLAMLPAVNGRVSIVVNAVAAATRLSFLMGGSTNTGFIDNISVRELPGNHLTQSTTTARPMLSARYNLLTQTEAFNEAVWTKQLFGQILSNQTVAPDGTLTADKLVLATGKTNTPAVSQGISTETGVKYILTIRAKAAEKTSILFVAGGSFGGGTIRVNLLTGGIVVVSAVGVVDYSAQIDQEGFYLVTLTMRAVSTGSGTMLVRAVNDDGTAYTGNGVDGIYIWGADLRVANDGVNLPPYQRVGVGTAGSSSSAGSADYDTTGFPLYLRFDGVDDWLAFNPQISGGDAATIFIAMRPLVASPEMTIISNSDISGTLDGQLTLAVNRSSGTGFLARSRGTAPSTIDVANAAWASPRTAVLCQSAKISTDVNILRRNGAQIASSTSDQGAGNYANRTFALAARTDGLQLFNGRIYSLIVRGAATSDEQIAQTEAWVNNKTKAYTS